MELNVGDYCRTSNGNIFKIIGGNGDNYEIDIDYSKLEQTEENWLELYRYNDNCSFFNNKNIIKSSPKIIDLIEVGDYVNGERIQFITNKGQLLTDGGYNLFKKYENIKSIVTHEQFEAMQYVVGEE